jgi:hypothetical protein
MFLTTTGTLPTGLTANTLYYVIFVSSSTFRLATTYANAIAGTAINTSVSQSGVHTAFACPFGLGNGTTTFNVPAMMAASPRGKGTSTVFTANETVQLGLAQNDQFQGHFQDLMYKSGATANAFPAANAGTSNAVGTPDTVYTQGASPLKAGTAITDGVNGTPRTGDETRGKSIGVNYGIRY